MRHFYQVYSKDQIGEMAFTQSESLTKVKEGFILVGHIIWF